MLDAIEMVKFATKKVNMIPRNILLALLSLRMVFACNKITPHEKKPDMVINKNLGEFIGSRENQGETESVVRVRRRIIIGDLNIARLRTWLDYLSYLCKGRDPTPS